MRTTVTALILGMFLAAGSHAQSQPTPTPGVYRLEIVMHEAGDTAAKAGRHYTMLIGGSGKGTFKVGNRVPMPIGPGPQVTYIDVGMNIECRLREEAGRVELLADMDSSSVLPQNPAAQPSREPTISQLKISVDSILEPGKRATVASVQDPVTQRDLIVEATVTRVQ